MDRAVVGAVFVFSDDSVEVPPPTGLQAFDHRGDPLYTRARGLGGRLLAQRLRFAVLEAVGAGFTVAVDRSRQERRRAGDRRFGDLARFHARDHRTAVEAVDEGQAGVRDVDLARWRERHPARFAQISRGRASDPALPFTDRAVLGDRVTPRFGDIDIARGSVRGHGSYIAGFLVCPERTARRALAAQFFFIGAFGAVRIDRALEAIGDQHPARQGVHRDAVWLFQLA